MLKDPATGLPRYCGRHAFGLYYSSPPFSMRGSEYIVSPPHEAETVYQMSYTAELSSRIKIWFALEDTGVTTPDA